MHEEEPETITLKNDSLRSLPPKYPLLGYEAFDLGILRKGSDIVSINQGRRIGDAKQAIIELFDDGYTYAHTTKRHQGTGSIRFGALYAGINVMWRGNYATDHDVVVAKKLAYVMCGGDLSEPTLVSEQYLLDLEREAFLSLCGEKKTLERIQSVLKGGKPIRN